MSVTSYIENSPRTSTDSFQSLLSVVSNMFDKTPDMALGPTSMNAPWPYAFKKGDEAYAKGVNGKWRLVTLLDDGEFDEEVNAVIYTAQWINPDAQTLRGTFCPTRGEIKPHDNYIRRLMENEQVELQHPGRDVCNIQHHQLPSV